MERGKQVAEIMNWLRKNIAWLSTTVMLIVFLSGTIYSGYRFLTSLQEMTATNRVYVLTLMIQRLEERYGTDDTTQMLPEDRANHKKWSRWLQHYQDQSLPELK